jgi:hypothetical protein
MGKIYQPPNEIGPPPKFQVSISYKEMVKLEEDWVKRLRKWCKDNSKEAEYIGDIVKQPVADGYAQYMIFSLKPVFLIHLELGDAYEFEWAHRWTAKDIKMIIEKTKELNNILQQASKDIKENAN